MKILFIDTVHPFLIENLKNDGHDCIEGYNFSLPEIEKNIGEVHGVVLRSRIKLDEAILKKADKLMFIARAGAGMESIDVIYARHRNIACLNSPEGNRDAVGEHAIGMLLSLMNNLNKADREVREGSWIREANRGHEINGKTFGIIGFGNMGSCFASKLKGFGCQVLAYDKYKSNFGDSSVKECTMEEIFNAADILSLHVPLTAETEYFVDDAFINKFRKNIFIINTARGKCLRIDDLVKNLKSRKVKGACLDVLEFEDLSFEKFSLENISSNPSWQYLIHSDHVILSPHIAGWTYESHQKISEVLYSKINSLINRMPN